MPTLISISEFQQMLGISRSTVYRLIERGEIGRVRIGRAVRIPCDDVHTYMRRLREAEASVAK